MENTLKNLRRELERKTEKYGEKMALVKSEVGRLTPERDLNAYHALQMNISELTTLAAEIQMVQDHISMEETYN